MEVLNAKKGARSDPACGTCRKKSRKCDRARPICRRCIAKGLECEGYPPRFQFFAHSSIEKRPRSRKESVKSSDFPTPTHGSTGVKQTRSVRNRQPMHPSLCNAVTSPQALCSPASTEASDALDNVLMNSFAQDMLSYFETTLCDRLAIVLPGLSNPFRTLVLPLCYQHVGAAQALIGMSICHLRMSEGSPRHFDLAIALEYRIHAIGQLSTLLIKEEVMGLSSFEEEVALAIVLLLILHDMCECGKSDNGTHLSGAASFCARFLAEPEKPCSELKAFLLTALAWLDILRGFSGAEKLAYGDDLRQHLFEKNSYSLETFVGCPSTLFIHIGQVLSAGKAYLDGSLSRTNFEILLADAESFFRAWSSTDESFPTSDPTWTQLAEAYRHACLLRIIRFPEPMELSCEDERVKASVSAILDICAQIPQDSPFHKRLLFPLFLAGADTASPHQKDYVSMRIEAIKDITGFRHNAMSTILSSVWTERIEQKHGWVNTPWMEYTCSVTLKRQHDYLFF